MVEFLPGGYGSHGQPPHPSWVPADLILYPLGVRIFPGYFGNLVTPETSAHPPGHGKLDLAAVRVFGLHVPARLIDRWNPGRLARLFRMTWFNRGYVIRFALVLSAHS